MGFLVSQHGHLGAIPPPPFLSVSPRALESMRSGGAIPPPQKGYLSDSYAIPYENKGNGCDTPLCDTISKGCCAICGGISHWAAKGIFRGGGGCIKLGLEFLDPVEPARPGKGALGGRGFLPKSRHQLLPDEVGEFSAKWVANFRRSLEGDFRASFAGKIVRSIFHQNSTEISPSNFTTRLGCGAQKKSFQWNCFWDCRRNFW